MQLIYSAGANQLDMKIASDISPWNDKFITSIYSTLTQLERDQLMLKIESMRNGKSWDDIENADNDQVSVTTSICPKRIYTHPFMPSDHNLFCSCHYQDMDLLKGDISKIQQLESELMRQNFSNACMISLPWSRTFF